MKLGYNTHRVRGAMRMAGCETTIGQETSSALSQARAGPTLLESPE
jgi:hypothetical protein